ncbi:MAG: hypothetical protein ACI860_000760 [Chitinophagales bacterium]|jgi:hypothetical protein
MKRHFPLSAIFISFFILLNAGPLKAISITTDPAGFSATSIALLPPCSEPNVPVASATPSLVCPGGSVNLSWTGSLNDAVEWFIYSGSCGGTFLGSTASNTFSVTPAAFPTTYYIRGEGGCSTPSTCGTIDILGDVTNPTVTCPGNQTGIANASCNFAVPDYTGMGTGADNCSIGALIQIPAAGTNVGSGTTIITLIAVDGSGNNASCSFNLVVSDNINPSITCPADQTDHVDGLCEFSILDYTSIATVSDNCTGSPIVTQSPAPGTLVGTGTTNIVLTAMDDSNNSASCNFNLLVTDTTQARIYCPGTQVGLLDASCTFTLIDYTNVRLEENCQGLTVTQDPIVGTVVGLGIVTVELTATDFSGNVSVCNFEINVLDFENPTITCPGNQTGTADGTCNYTVPNYISMATSGDNCGGVTVSQSPASGAIVGSGNTIISLTATDGEGNTSVCTFDLVVSDNTNPSISCPGTQTIAADASCIATLPNYSSSATVSDNCTANPTVSQVPIPGTVLGVGIWNIVLTAIDDDNNSSSCDFDFEVTDNINPIISCPGNRVEPVNNLCTFVIPDYTGMATASDNCITSTISQLPAIGTIVNIGPTIVTLTVTDGSNNTASCTFEVLVTDNTTPNISCPGNQTGSVDASCSFVIPDYTILATASNNCAAPPPVTQLPTPGSIVGVGIISITLTASNSPTNTANCSFNLTISDAINPMITCPGNQVGTVNSSCAFLLQDYRALATASDNCSGISIIQIPFPGTAVLAGITNVTLTASDGSNNTSSCSFDVVVADNTNPSITCLSNRTEPADASCNFTIPDYTGVVSSSDNCTASPTITQLPIAGTVVGAGVSTIVLTATDAANNSVNCTFDLLVTDNTSPSITCPATQTGIVSGSCEFTVLDYSGLATTNDNCSAVTVSQIPATGSLVGVGTFNIELTATDVSNNTTVCNFNLIVSDNINPSISCIGNQVGYVSSVCNFALPNYAGMASATDNCPDVLISQIPAIGTAVGVGTTTILLTAKDASNNTVNCSFNVVVFDTISPTITCPGNLVGFVDGSCNFSVPDYTVLGIANDNCTSTPTITQSPVPGTITGIGITSITLIATDASNNSANCSFSVDVSDNIPPSITCPGNQTESLNASCEFTLLDYTSLVTMVDNCTASPTLVQSPAAGTPVTGTTTLTFTATDAASNVSQCSFDVLLIDATPPTALCQSLDVYLDGSGSATILASDIDGGSNDDCVGISLSASQTTFDCTDLGVNNITLTATDGNLNAANCVAVVTVMDIIPPVLFCPQNQQGAVVSSCEFNLPDYTLLATATDNCGSVTITQSPAIGAAVGPGIHIVTLTANDGNGNNILCTFVLTVSAQAGGSQFFTECDGFSLTVGSNTYSLSGTYIDTLTGASSNGCDSILTSNLTILPRLSEQIIGKLCVGESIVVNGVTYDALNLSGTEIFPNVGPNGCDSIVTIDLTVSTINNNVTNTSMLLISDQSGADYQWLDCDNGYAIIPGETAREFAIPESGSFAVMVTLGFCTDTSDCDTITAPVTGIRGSELALDVSIHPNPSNGIFTISMNTTLENTSLVVYDVLGKTILRQEASSKHTSIDLSKYRKGVYFIDIQTPHGNLVNKVILH